MTVYELNATVTLSLTASSGATVTLHVTAPDGTESDPTPTFAGSQWSANVTADQYDVWLFAWSVNGTIVENGSFTVGGPWYGNMAELRFQVGRGTDTSADVQLARNLLASSRKVEEHCDERPEGGFLLDDTASARRFATRLRVCVAEGYRLMVDDIGHATITAEVGDGTTWTELTDIEVYPDNALEKGEAIRGLVSQTDWGMYRRARITARWGWPSVPSPVREATMLQANRLYKRPGSTEGVAGSSEWGLVRIPRLDPDVQSLLTKWHPDFRAR